ncbi:AraC family transcriptional regulator [Actinoplanes xinjiangensis]|uniref:AraC-like DNA-binding protein n=1 Tax=Actinoplanes xinjiangensis TaxID=512350 RepID=A0A316EI22_9ACTN|nr:AraC family transcriptional regulator [Actinoplanes xinjiangensis]PWK31209.1 AraC-like DNA-binding protein [Actinoplanes xinjiangensis]GIF44112.1 AraC family transcriptional regulator [Actinoplanes xinjiangensis]
MDVLSDVLAVMRTGRARSALVAWQAPWAQEFAPVPGAAGFHVMLRGSCVLLRDGAEPVRLAEGDIVFRAHGDGHALADAPGTRPIAPACAPAPAGGPPPRAGAGATVTLCGAYELDPDLVHPLVRDLPDLIHVPAGSDPRLAAVVDHLAAELTEPGPGSDALIPALLDTMLVHLLRTCLGGRHRTGWAAALADPVTAAALHAMHREPGRNWTVAGLAATGGLSRAPFARRFTGLLGRPPLTYLTWWRMTMAAGLLRRTDLTVGAVAGRVGYGSEFAFAAAFKRRFGMPPGRYRRRPGGADQEIDR